MAAPAAVDALKRTAVCHPIGAAARHRYPAKTCPPADLACPQTQLLPPTVPKRNRAPHAAQAPHIGGEIHPLSMPAGKPQAPVGNTKEGAAPLPESTMLRRNAGCSFCAEGPPAKHLAGKTRIAPVPDPSASAFCRKRRETLKTSFFTSLLLLLSAKDSQTGRKAGHGQKPPDAPGRKNPAGLSSDLPGPQAF